MTWLLLAMLMIAPADAKPGKKALEAERARLTVELENLVGRSAWSGVERTYESMLALGIGLEPATHMLAAKSAEAQGDMTNALIRLDRALNIPNLDEVKDDPRVAAAIEARNAVLARYGRVEITAVPLDRIPALLRQGPAPFAPAEQEAIAAARGTLLANRTFKGLLPIGDYAVDGYAFSVAPNTSEWIMVTLPGQ